MPYLINGSSASVGPVGVVWHPITQGVDWNNQPFYSGFRIEMQFGIMSIDDGAQWLNAVSAGSVNLTIINRWATDFTSLSGVYCSIPAPPAVQDIHLEPFTIMVHGVY